MGQVLNGSHWLCVTSSGPFPAVQLYVTNACCMHAQECACRGVSMNMPYAEFCRC